MRPLLAASVLLAAIPGQRPWVDPPAFAHVPATRATGWPVGHPDRRVLRYQEIHDAIEGQPRAIAAVAFRRSLADTTPAPAFTATLSLTLSTATRPAAQIGARFADNAGSDAALVIDDGAVAFPASAGPWSPVAPFDFVLPAASPWGFAGLGPLCIELAVRDHRGRTPLLFDLHEADVSVRRRLGPGCATMTADVVLNAGVAAVQLRSLPKEDVALVLLGSEVATFAGAPLPLDLGPLGAPGCSLQLAPATLVPTWTGRTGSVDLQLDTTALPPGGWFAVQALAPAINAAGNRLRLGLTDGWQLIPRSARGAGRVWAESLGAEEGTPQPVYGLVLEVR